MKQMSPGLIGYHRHMAQIFLRMDAAALVAQTAIGLTGPVPLWQALLINAGSAAGLAALAALLPFQHLRPLVLTTYAVAVTTTSLGLIHVCGGFGGSPFGPELWVGAIGALTGFHGSRILTWYTVGIGLVVFVGGRLLCPDMVFSVGGDQSWPHVAAMTAWWCAIVLSTGFSGVKIIAIAARATQVREALQAEKLSHLESVAAAQHRLSTVATDQAQTLRELAQVFEGQVSTVVETVAQKAGQIRSRAIALSASATTTGRGAADTVGLASAAAADTRIVAQAANRLQDSFGIVNSQTRAAAAAADHVSGQVGQSDAALGLLDQAADQVGRAVALIGGIAARTRLLALNATIESAHAGEAGRGFAVVADEVKQLAKQTASTTQEVEQLVGGMRDASHGVALALSKITEAIRQVSHFAASVDGAIDNQAIAVAEITHTAEALRDKASRLSTEVSGVAESAETTSAAARDMLDTAALLTADATVLQRESESFIGNVHAA